MQLINGISSDLQKLLKYFNGRASVAFYKIPFALSATVFPNNLPKRFKVITISNICIKISYFIFRIKS